MSDVGLSDVGCRIVLEMGFRGVCLPHRAPKKGRGAYNYVATRPRNFPLLLSPSCAKKCKRINIYLKITKKKKREREKERDQNTRIPGVPPIPSTMQLPILTGVSALTAAVGDGFGSFCGPLIV